jgi:hypothetical protein
VYPVYTSHASPRAIIWVHESVRRGFGDHGDRVLRSLCSDIKTTLWTSLEDDNVEVIWTTYAGGTTMDVLVDLEQCWTRQVEAIREMLVTNNHPDLWSTAFEGRQALIRVRTPGGEMYQLKTYIRRPFELFQPTGTEGVGRSHD